MENNLNLLHKAAAKNLTDMQQHLKELQERNEMFKKAYDKKHKELGNLDYHVDGKHYADLEKKVNQMGIAIAMNENTIKELQNML
jgi:hypothetical protein